MTACARCGQLGPWMPQQGLVLCPAHPLAPVSCAPFQHAYRAGQAEDGSMCWRCQRCGSTLASQAFTTAVMPADQTPATWQD